MTIISTTTHILKKIYDNIPSVNIYAKEIGVGVGYEDYDLIQFSVQNAIDTFKDLEYSLLKLPAFLLATTQVPVANAEEQKEYLMINDRFPFSCYLSTSTSNPVLQNVISMIMGNCSNITPSSSTDLAYKHWAAWEVGDDRVSVYRQANGPSTAGWECLLGVLDDNFQRSEPSILTSMLLLGFLGAVLGTAILCPLIIKFYSNHQQRQVQGNNQPLLPSSANAEARLAININDDGNASENEDRRTYRLGG